MMAAVKGNEINGKVIFDILSTEGPVVSCVLLRAKTAEYQSSKKDEKQPAEESSNNTKKDKNNKEPGRKHEILVDLIEEIKIDTTPKKQMVSKVIGGPITFIGQYEEEGIVLIARNVEGKEPFDLPPVNPHILQPPFNSLDVRGDILIMKVAEVVDDEGASETDNNDNNNSNTSLVVPTNNEFFLNYKKEDYLTFAARTDIKVPEHPDENDDEEDSASSDEEDSEEENDNEEEDDESYDPEHEIDDEEENRAGMMNFLMASLLRKFTEENNRGPNTQELLNIRSALASKVGIQLEEVPSWDDPVTRKKKRIIESKDGGCKSILKREREYDENSSDDIHEPTLKRVNFNANLEKHAEEEVETDP